jgi:hypothetical protein
VILLAEGGLFTYGVAVAIVETGEKRFLGLAIAVFSSAAWAIVLIHGRAGRVGSPMVLGPVKIRGAVSEALVFPRPIRTRLLATFSALLFVAFGAILIVVVAPRFEFSPVIYVVGAASILLFGYIGVATGLALVRGRVEGLVLLPVGMGWAGGGETYLVPWDAISSVGLRMIPLGLGRSASVCVSVEDPRIVQASPFVRLWMLLNRRRVGSDIVLPSGLLGITVERLIPIIERYRTNTDHRREIGTPAGLAAVKQLL